MGDIDQQDLEEYESMKKELENVDDLQTECDIDEDIAEWNDVPVEGTEFETKICEEMIEYDEAKIEEVDKLSQTPSAAAGSAAKTANQLDQASSVEAVEASSPTTAGSNKPGDNKMKQALEQAGKDAQALEKNVSLPKSLETDVTSEASTVIEAINEDKNAAKPAADLKSVETEVKSVASDDVLADGQTPQGTVFAPAEKGKMPEKMEAPLTEGKKEGQNIGKDSTSGETGDER